MAFIKLMNVVLITTAVAIAPVLHSKTVLSSHFRSEGRMHISNLYDNKEAINCFQLIKTPGERTPESTQRPLESVSNWFREMTISSSSSMQSGWGDVMTISGHISHQLPEGSIMAHRAKIYDSAEWWWWNVPNRVNSDVLDQEFLWGGCELENDRIYANQLNEFIMCWKISISLPEGWFAEGLGLLWLHSLNAWLDFWTNCWSILQIVSTVWSSNLSNQSSIKTSAQIVWNPFQQKTSPAGVFHPRKSPNNPRNWSEMSNYCALFSWYRLCAIVRAGIQLAHTPRPRNEY